MPQIFKPWVNRVPLMILAGVAAGGLLVPAFVWYYFSPEYTDVGYQPEQPIPFSHALHAGELEMDCRYCHAQVEKAAVASVPTSKMCNNCHSLVLRDSPQLAALRDSLANNEPVPWVRVHKVPQYAFFDHGVHVRGGVGCQSCHGDIRSMEVVTLEEPLSMGWCLECHRNPDMHIRSLDEITDTTWEPPSDQVQLAANFIEERNLQPPEDCSGCHR